MSIPWENTLQHNPKFVVFTRNLPAHTFIAHAHCTNELIQTQFLLSLWMDAVVNDATNLQTIRMKLLCHVCLIRGQLQSDCAVPNVGHGPLFYERTVISHSSIQLWASSYEIGSNVTLRSQSSIPDWRSFKIYWHAKQFDTEST